MPIRFGEFSIDPETYELRQDDRIVDVEPLVFDLILHFASNPEQVFSREALIESVWKGRIVSDATISTCVKNARRALGDTGESQNILQTVRGRGYRFIAKTSQATKSPSIATSSDLSDPSQVNNDADPSLFILPFRCLSDDSKVNDFLNNLTNELGTVLTRIPLLRISAETNYFQGHDPQPTARQVHEQFGVDFVLDGSATQVDTNVQVNVQLSDAKTGFRVWAESFDLNPSTIDGFEQCKTAVIGKLEPQLHRGMFTAVQSVTGKPNARQLFLEASGTLVMHGWNHVSFEKASEILERSVALDPSFALAPALQSLLFGFGSRIGLPMDPDAAREDAKRTADQALQLDSMNSTILGLAGCSLSDIGYPERGEALLHNAIELNPANAQAWVALGAVRLTHNDLKEAIAKLSKGISISPLDSRLSVWGALLAIAQIMSNKIDVACETAETACRRHDQTYLPRIPLAAARFIQGDTRGASTAMVDARRIKPDLSQNQIAALVGREMTSLLQKL